MRREEHDQDEYQPDHDRVPLHVRRHLLLEQDEERAADDGPDQRAEPADHDHDDELAGHAPVHEVRRGIGRAPGVEGPGEAGQDRRDQAHPHLVALHVVAEEPRAVLVLADGDEHLTEVRAHQHAAGEVREQEVQDDRVVDPDRRVDGDAGQDLRRRQALNPVRPAEGLGIAEDGVDHLGEDQREEGEVDPAPDGGEVAHDEGIGADDDHGERETQPERQDAALEQHRRRVRAESEERGMAERHEARVAHQEIQAHRHRPEQERVEGEQHVVLGHPRGERQRRERGEDHPPLPGQEATQGRPRGRRTRAAGRSGPRS